MISLLVFVLSLETRKLDKDLLVLDTSSHYDRNNEQLMGHRNFLESSSQDHLIEKTISKLGSDEISCVSPLNLKLNQSLSCELRQNIFPSYFPQE